MTEPTEPFLGYYPSAELVIAFVCPLGIDYRTVVKMAEDRLGEFGYGVNHIRLSDYFADLAVKLGDTWHPPSDTGELAEYKIKTGNRIRELSGRKDFLALVAASAIADRREKDSGDIAKEWRHPLDRTAHLITTLKRPEEVDTLRRIYGNGFFLAGLYASESARKSYLEDRGMKSAAEALILADAEASC